MNEGKVTADQAGAIPVSALHGRASASADAARLRPIRAELALSPSNGLSRKILQYSSEDESLAWMDGGTLTIQADVDKFANVTIESSDTIGLNLSNSCSESGNISGLTFADIDGHSLFIAPDALSVLGGPIVLDEDETALAVNADDPVNEPTTIKNLGFPYRLWDGELWVSQLLTIEPGVTLLLTSGVGLYTPAGRIEAIGTEEEPIVWTSPLENPTGSDLWGSIDDISGLGARFDYNHFEYGGDDVNEALLLFRNGDFELSNVSFANIETSAIGGSTCNGIAEFIDAWCAFEFTNVAVPVRCNSGVDGYINGCE